MFLVLSITLCVLIELCGYAAIRKAVLAQYGAARIREWTHGLEWQRDYTYTVQSGPRPDSAIVVMCAAVIKRSARGLSLIDSSRLLSCLRHRLTTV